MAVLQAGKALVSGGWAWGPPSLCTFSCTRWGCSPGLCPLTPQGGADNEDDDDDEELGDEAMMALDKSLASLFAEQKLRIQARKDEKNKLQKENALRRDFQIRVSPGPALPLAPPRPSPCPHPHAWLSSPFPLQVLDLIEVLVTKQPENPLVLELLEPLLLVIRRSMRSNSSAKQEQDLLHKTARIFT